MRIASTLALASLLIAAAALSCSRGPRVEFAGYDHKAYEAARSEGKPILIYATADWCSACTKLNRAALSDPAVAAALEPFARFKLDCTNYKTDKVVQAQLVALKVEAFPTLIFIDRNGAELPYITGNQPPETIIDTAKLASES